MSDPRSREGQADASAYKERAARTMTLLITGKLIKDDREGLCRVRNISSTGMKIETPSHLEVNQIVHVAMRNGGAIAARVAWTRDGAAGLAFLEALDVSATLAAQVPQSRILRSRVPRGPRLAIEHPIEVEARRAPHQASLLDISQGGARVRLPFRPALNEALVLTVPGLPLKSGAVRWVQGTECGVGFYEAFAFDTLAGWAEACGEQVRCDRPAHPEVRRVSP